MVGWAFSLAMAGNFPALVMGIWYKRTTTTAAVLGIIAGFGLCLFYLVVSRYFPGFGVKYAGMTSLLNPVTGGPIIPDLAKAMTAPNAMEMMPTLAHPLANKVGWFNLNNINCGLLGVPVGFAVIYIVSQFTKAAVEGDTSPRRRDPQAARQDDPRRKDLIAARRLIGNGAPPGPVLFSRPVRRFTLRVSRRE